MGLGFNIVGGEMDNQGRETGLGNLSRNLSQALKKLK